MMQVLNYSVGNAAPRAGLLSGNHVFDAPRASVHELLEDLSSLKTKGSAIPLAEVKLHAPLLYPGTIYCAGANYADHVVLHQAAARLRRRAGRARGAAARLAEARLGGRACRRHWTHLP